MELLKEKDISLTHMLDQSPTQHQTFIHIGYHKSASTYLQQSVFPALPVNYIFFGSKDRKYLDLIESENAVLEPIVSWINSLIKIKPDYKNVVISHEELSGHPHGHKSVCPYQISDNLKKIFPNAKIIMIIRNQFEYLRSIYAFRTAIKGYEFRSFDKFVADEIGMGLQEHLEYQNLIEQYYNLFGKESVLVLPMEKLIHAPQDFMVKLCMFLNVPVLKEIKNTPVNTSTQSQFILNFWRPVNFLFFCILKIMTFLNFNNDDKYPFKEFRYSFYRFKTKMTASLQKVSWTKGKIGYMQLKKYDMLKTVFQKSNDITSGLINENLKELGYP